MHSPQLERLKETLSGHYQFERELGEGAFATVFLARDLRLERPVAIKVLNVDPASEVGEIRFLREVRFLANLQHPNIVPVHDSGHLENLLYYVMPFIRGESLRERLRREGRLPIADAVRIACEIGDAVDAAHNANIIHRDIKPENILLSGAHPMLADFGVARAATSSQSKQLTRDGYGSPGTPAYMSPEQLLGEKDLDKRSDIYALGCVLFETLTGHAPFEGSGGFVKRFTDPPPSSRELRPEIPVHVDQVLQTALARLPADRFASAAEMCSALTDADQARTIVPASTPVQNVTANRSAVSKPSAAEVREVQWSRRLYHRALSHKPALAVLLTILVIVSASAALMTRSRHPAESDRTLDPRRIAVLDFDDASPDHSLGYLASGLAVSLTRELSEAHSIEVVSRNAIRALRQRNATIDSLIYPLRIGSLVEGTVQKSANRLRVTVQLVDAVSKTQLASAAVERDTGELFLLEDDLSHQAATLLRRRLGSEIRVRETSAGTRSAKARDLVFKADKIVDDLSANEGSDQPTDVSSELRALQGADSLLAEAQSTDKDWAAPVLRRGWVQLEIATRTGGGARVAAFNKGMQYAQNAILRNPDSAEGFELRGTGAYKQVARLEFPAKQFSAMLTQSENDLKHAISIDSSRATAWGTLALVHVANGDVVEAERDAQTALAMDTYLREARTIVGALYVATLMKGSFGDSWRWCLRGARDYPRDFRFIDCQLTLLAEDTRNRPDVGKTLRLGAEAKELDPPATAKAAGRQFLPIYRQMMVAIVLARAGQADSARSVAHRATAGVGDGNDLHTDILYEDAFLHLVLGERDQSIKLLAEYLRMRPALRGLVGRHPRWKPLWSDPRFVQLVSPTRI